MKKQQEANKRFNGNSETVTTLIPNVFAPAAGIWNGKICPLKEEWLRPSPSRCDRSPPLKSQAHSMD